MRLIAFLLITFLYLPATAKSSDWIVNCTQFPKGQSGGICIHTPKEDRSEDIAYYLHGRGGSEQTWKEDWYYTSQLRSYWKSHRIKKPTVVSISFGEQWLLAEKNASPYSGLFNLVTAQLIPNIEQQLGGLKGRRIVFGESMGGFNSAQLALKTDLFDRAGILCSPMAEVSPFAPEQDVRSYIESTSAWQYFKSFSPETVLNSVSGIIKLLQAFYPTQEIWNTADPLMLAKNPKSTDTELYVAVGFYDRYAAYEGNEVFVNSLKASGMSVEWRPQWGDHCAIDIPSLAEFLTSSLPK